MTQAFINGNSIYLRDLRMADVEGSIVAWNNDKDVTRFLYRGTFPARPQELRDEYLRISKSSTDVEMAIVEKPTEKLIGVTGIHSIDWISRIGEFRILIGERSALGKGYGTEVTTLMLAYCFEVLNLHKVFLGVNAENTRALKCYQRVGFQTEGEFRQEFYRAGKYFNIVRMGLLQSEYREMSKKWKNIKTIRELFPTPQ